MNLQGIRHIYDHSGPFATVYFESRSPAEDAGNKIRLRWDDLRGRLEDAGADESVTAALEKAVNDVAPAELLASGRVLVANSEGVLFDEPWDSAMGAGDAAHLSDEPEMGAYIRESARAVRLVVALVDQKGAVVREVVAAEQHSVEEDAEHVRGPESSESVHRPREGAMSHNQIQRRADEAVTQNARGIVEHLEKTVGSWSPDLIIIAGEEQGRTAVLQEIPDSLSSMVREVERGGSVDQGAEDALAEELRVIAGEVTEARAQRNAERYEYAKAHNQIAEGTQAVARAAEMGAVETLLLDPEKHATEEAALLAASARIGAEADIFNADGAGAVAALLRYEAPEEVRSV